MLARAAFFLLCAALAADLAGSWLSAPALWTVGWYLMAAGAALGACHVLLGGARLARGDRPRGGEARRGLRRLLLEPVAVALVALGWWVRGAAVIPPDPAVLLVEAVVLAALALSGWAGRPRPTVPFEPRTRTRP